MRFMDLTGNRYGNLRVIAKSIILANTGRALWDCLCICGNYTLLRSTSLRSGHTQSCGCLHIEQLRERATTHKNTINRIQSPTYVSWYNMKTRCLNPKATYYKYYGGRGITISIDWINSFEAFLADMGERPAGTSIDRIDPNGNYSKENCRWATKAQQAQNRRKPI